MRKFKRLLVTGGAGFIGSNFVRFLSQYHPDIEVIILDKLTYAGNKNNLLDVLGSKIKLVIGDICDEKLVDSLIADVDGIINFAAESHVDNSLINAAPFIDSNISGVSVLLTSARKYGVYFHQVSTDEVFGDLPLNQVDKDGQPTKFDEFSPYKPSSPYAATKASADMLVRAWHRSYQLDVTISICTNNYGPYQHAEKFIPHQILRLLHNQPAEVYGDGRNVRDWIHVDDHVRAIWQIMVTGEAGETYLVSADNQLSNLTIVNELLALMNKKPTDIVYVPDRAGHDLRYALDATKIKSGLDWQPLYNNLLKYLPILIEYYNKNSYY